MYICREKKKQQKEASVLLIIKHKTQNTKQPKHKFLEINRILWEKENIYFKMRLYFARINYRNL